jgi:hypothetical protein
MTTKVHKTSVITFPILERGKEALMPQLLYLPSGLEMNSGQTQGTVNVRECRGPIQWTPPSHAKYERDVTTYCWILMKRSCRLWLVITDDIFIWHIFISSKAVKSIIVLLANSSSNTSHTRTPWKREGNFKYIPRLNSGLMQYVRAETACPKIVGTMRMRSMNGQLSPRISFFETTFITT